MISAPMVLQMLWLHWVTQNDLPEKEWTWLDCDLIMMLPDRPGGQSLEKSGLLSGCVP